MRSSFWRCVGGDRRVHELSSVRRSSSSFSFQSSVSREILCATAINEYRDSSERMKSKT